MSGGVTSDDHISPLGVLLTTMRKKWRANEQDAAVALARIAAPFVHARPGRAGARAPTETELQALTDAQLETLIRQARAEPAPDDPRQPD